MGTLGPRNFGFRTPPVGRERAGRYYLDEPNDVPIGAPVIVPSNFDAGDSNRTDALPLRLAKGAQDRPFIQGIQGGIVFFEHAPTSPAFAGRDTGLDTYADLDMVPHDEDGVLGNMCQLISGAGMLVVFNNTFDRTFLNVRSYEGRIMVAGVSVATPTLAVGDYLTPGQGDDNGGYWAETSTADEAWLQVERVDTDRDEVEARLLF